MVPESFLHDALGYDVELGPNGGSGTVRTGVAEMTATLLGSGVISAMPLPPSCFPFIIPKSSEKVTLILSCLGMNERISNRPTFQLPSWEGIARLLAATPRSRHLFCTHVHLTNVFWSFRVPPPEMRAAFRFRSMPGGQIFARDRLPFGWKISPIFCQRILGDLVRPLVTPHMEVLHYLEDFLIVGRNPEQVQALTDRIVEAVRAASFIVSQKSTLQLVQKLFFFGKWLDLEARETRSHPRAFLQMFHAWVRLACKSRPNSRLMPKMLGFLQWHVTPRVSAGPHLAGGYCHERWGSDTLPTPTRVLHSLVRVMTRCAQPWSPHLPIPSALHMQCSWTRCQSQSSSDLQFLSMPRGTVLDTGWEGGYQGGGCAPGLS